MADQSTLDEFDLIPASESDLHECEICGRSFDTSKGLGIHRSQSHDEQKVKEVYIAELQRLADDLEKPPGLRDMDKEGAHSSKTYQDAFGSWNEALKQAGIGINNEHDIAKSDLLNELTRLNEQLGRTPTSRDMAKQGEYGTSNYPNKFGSWNNAVREAGLEPTREREVPTEDLLEDLERVAEEVGYAPTTTQMKQHGGYGITTYITRFGSWNDAVREVGFEPTREKNVSESDLLSALQDLSDELGRTPNAVEMDKNGEYSVGTYDRRFGSWNNALRASNLDINNRTKISETELIAELKNLATELNRTPRVIDMDVEGEFGSATYRTSFGSWAEALNRADLEHKRILHPDHLDHLARSGYEVEVAEMLLDIGIEYEYEGLVIEYENDRTYTPDFVTDEYVIEVKGYVHRNEVELAEIALEKLENKRYVVIQADGPKLPADIHIPWDERENLRQLFD